MISKETRMTILVNLAILAVGLLVLLLIRELFYNGIQLFLSAFVAILLPFSIALFISYLVAPVFKVLEKHIRLKNRLINTIIVFSLIGILLFFIGRFAGVLIYTQAVAFIENDWPNVVSYFETSFSEGSPIRDTYNWLAQYISIGSREVISVDIIRVFQSVTTIVLTIIMTPVFLFFILNDKERIYKSLMQVFPRKWRHHAIELTGRANRVVEEYFNGRFLTMTAMAIFFTIMLFIFGFEGRAVLFGFMLGFFDIVPYVGPTIAVILPVLYSLTEDDLLFGQYAPIAIFIANFIGQMIQNNVAQPLIMGRETKIHPLLVLSAFVFFAYLFGVVGLILAIPITGTIKSTIEYIKELHQDEMELTEEEEQQIEEATQ
ncbi:MAG: AI-2E family transporter [Bacillota bacterium]